MLDPSCFLVTACVIIIKLSSRFVCYCVDCRPRRRSRNTGRRSATGRRVHSVRSSATPRRRLAGKGQARSLLRTFTNGFHFALKRHPMLNNEPRGRSRSRSLGSQPPGDVVINPVVGCHYFPPGPRLPFQSESVTALCPVPNYTAW